MKLMVCYDRMSLKQKLCSLALALQMMIVRCDGLDFESSIEMKFAICALVVLFVLKYPTFSIGLRWHAIVLSDLIEIVVVAAAVVVVAAAAVVGRLEP